MTTEQKNNMVAIGLRRIFFFNQIMQHEVEWLIGTLPNTKIDRILRVVNQNLKNQLLQSKICLGDEARAYLNDVLRTEEVVALGSIMDMLAGTDDLLALEDEIKAFISKHKDPGPEGQLQYPKSW